MAVQSQPEPVHRDTLFDRAADFMTTAIGTPIAFAVAASVVIGWAVAGPVAGFSTTWQLFINTFTTISTFLMVFLLGNASNRITENQDRMLQGILDEERSLESEERMIEKLLERMDASHLRRIGQHLNRQDQQLAEAADRILAALRPGAPPAA